MIGWYLISMGKAVAHLRSISLGETKGSQVSCACRREIATEGFEHLWATPQFAANRRPVATLQRTSSRAIEDAVPQMGSNIHRLQDGHRTRPVGIVNHADTPIPLLKGPEGCRS